MKQPRFIIAVLALTLILSACQKSIDLPDPALEKLFGRWDWVRSSGGFTGGTGTTASAGSSHSVEFSKNGVFSYIADGKVKDKVQFKVDVDTYYSYQKAYLISYNSTGLFGAEQNPYPSELVDFKGDDTLFLTEVGCADCFAHVYVRSR